MHCKMLSGCVWSRPSSRPAAWHAAHSPCRVTRTAVRQAQTPSSPSLTPEARCGLSPAPASRRVAQRRTLEVHASGSAASAIEGTVGQEAKQIKLIAWWSFWSQIALAIVSTVVLCFTIGTGSAPGSAPPAAALCTLFGVVTSFISTFIAYGVTRTMRRVLVNGEEVKRAAVEGSLLAANRLNFLGIGATLLGLQASVGGLVAKTLTTSSSNPYAQAGRPATAPTTALDVFSVQACANTIFSHFVSLLFVNWLQRILLKQPKGSVAPPSPGGLPAGGKFQEEDYTARPGRKGPKRAAY